MTTTPQPLEGLPPSPNEWAECQRISGLPEVDDLFRTFIQDDATNDTAVMIVRAVRREALRAHAASAEPVAMVLHCPKCGMQHIDAQEPEEIHTDQDGTVLRHEGGWDNPPHRSHLCHGCGTIWRPADVSTTGVAAIETRGKADTWPVHADEVKASAAHVAADVGSARLVVEALPVPGYVPINGRIHPVKPITQHPTPSPAQATEASGEKVFVASVMGLDVYDTPKGEPAQAVDERAEFRRFVDEFTNQTGFPPIGFEIWTLARAALQSSRQPQAQPQQVPASWRAALQKFVDRVERGDIRSRQTYAEFKELLQQDCEHLHTEAEIRKKIADELWTSAFMHCDGNKDHILLCIKSGTTLRLALQQESIDPDDHEAVNSYVYKAYK